MKRIVLRNNRRTVAPEFRTADGAPSGTAKNRRPSAQALALVSYNVKRLRCARGITQHELARRSKLGHGYIGDVERDAVNIGLGNLEALAVGLECSLLDLFMPPAKAPAREGDETDVTRAHLPN